MGDLELIKQLERHYFQNMEDNTLYYLSYYCYLNGEYYKSYMYSEKDKFTNLNVVYNILSLVKLGYIEAARDKFTENIDLLVKLYDDVDYKLIDEEVVKQNILQLFIVFENDKLVNKLSDIENKEKYIYTALIRSDYSKLSGLLVDYSEQGIKEIILDNIKSKLSGEKKQTHIDTNNIEKASIDIGCESQFYDFECSDGDVEIISYKHGENIVNMHVLRFEDQYVVVDCGAYVDEFGEINYFDVEGFFDKNSIDKSKIKGVFITHAHLDHYGSIDELKDFEIYMTKDTYDLIKISCAAREIDICEYDITLVNPQKSYKVGEFVVEVVPNGHILGSCAYIFDIPKIGKRALFTGDFCLNDQNLVEGMRLNRICDIDYLVTETTYGKRKFSFSYQDRLNLLLKTIESSLANNVPVFIPAFAMGRAQELLKVIAQNFPYNRILVDGSAAKVSKIYNKHYSELVADNVEYLRDDLTIGEKLEEFDIIISSSGMLQKGTMSKAYLDFIIEKSKLVTIIKSGFINPKSSSYEELISLSGVDYHYFDVGISAHATYNQLKFLIDYVGAEKVVMVHGEGLDI